MRTDGWGFIISETSGSPSNMGDSCAETARLAHLNQRLGWPYNENLDKFRTDIGYVRHPSPELPLDWRESDFSSDQALPLYLAYRSIRYQFYAEEMKETIKRAGWRTGNGTLVNPLFFSLLVGKRWLINLAVAGQSLIFKIPFRWSDSKKKFESTSEASGDYLNWFHASLYASPWARRLVPPSVMIQKLEHYYRNEPNSKELINLYKRVIEKEY